MHNFGEQAHFVDFPSKFISQDGRTAWLCYATNFTNGYLRTNYRDEPPAGGSGMNLHEIRFLRQIVETTCASGLQLILCDYLLRSNSTGDVLLPRLDSNRQSGYRTI